MAMKDTFMQITDEEIDALLHASDHDGDHTLNFRGERLFIFTLLFACF